MKLSKRVTCFSKQNWRPVVTAVAFVMLSGCAERAYLSDDGWRAAVGGVPEEQAQAGTPIIPTITDGDADADQPYDATLVSAGDSSCTIDRLAATNGDPTDAELRAGFACVMAQLAPSYGASGHVLVRRFAGWGRVTSTPFFSDVLGDRYGVVFANARALGQEGADEHYDRGFPVGATLAVPTFTVSDGGAVEGGPLVLVEKMEPGFFALQGNWRYSIVGTDGRVAAVTRGINASDVSVCTECTHSQADLFYASLLNDGVIPYAEGAGPAFPSVDTYGSSGGLIPPTEQQESDVTRGEMLGDGEVLDPNAPVFDPNAPVLDPNAPITDD